MKLTREQRNKINDFKNVYMQIFNKDNDDYMRLVIETIFKNVEKNYEEFSDDVHKVSVYDENDGFNILKPYNGYYSLLDFLLNRVFKGIQKISDDENSYEDKERNVRLSKKRYDSYKGFSDDFIYMQKVKSIMHESGHALQHRTGWFNYKKGFNKINGEGLIPNTGMEYIAKVLKTNLGYKYDLNTDFYDTKGYLSPFNNNSLLGEGLNEMYASLFSGVLEYNLGSKNDGAILKQNSRKDDNRVRTSYRRNCFNGYGQSKYFYILRVLVSKKSIFNSLYLGKDDMIDEFCIKYKDILNNYEKKFGSSIKVYNYSNNFFKNLLNTIGYIYAHPECGIIHKYEKLLDNIFIDVLKRKIDLMTEKDEELEKVISNIYWDTYMYVEKKSDNKLVYVDSDEKRKYNELYKKLKEKNDPTKKSVDVFAFGVFGIKFKRKTSFFENILVYKNNNKYNVSIIDITKNNDINIKGKDSLCKELEKLLNAKEQEGSIKDNNIEKELRYYINKKHNDIEISNNMINKFNKTIIEEYKNSNKHR